MIFYILGIAVQLKGRSLVLPLIEKRRLAFNAHLSNCFQIDFTLSGVISIIKHNLKQLNLGD